MIALLCSIAGAASWDAPPTTLAASFAPSSTGVAVREHVAQRPAEQVGADFAREAHAVVTSWYAAELPILSRGEYGGQVASLRDDLARHVANLDAFGVVPASRGRAAVAEAVRVMPVGDGELDGWPAEVGDWRPTGALAAWGRQLEHLAAVAERQAFGRSADEDGGAARLAADARWLATGFRYLEFMGC